MSINKKILILICWCCCWLFTSAGKFFDIKKLEKVSLASTKQLNGVHSQLECVLNCQQRFPTEKRNAFYANDGKCFCVSDNGIAFDGELNGNLISQV